MGLSDFVKVTENSNAGGLCNIRGIFEWLHSERNFVSIDLASDLFQFGIEEAEKGEAALRDSHGCLWSIIDVALA